MAEWSKAGDCKSFIRKYRVSSNLTLTSNFYNQINNHKMNTDEETREGERDEKILAPLTKVKSNIRVKKKDNTDVGKSVSSRQESITSDCYIEMQSRVCCDVSENPTTEEADKQQVLGFDGYLTGRYRDSLSFDVDGKTKKLCGISMSLLRLFRKGVIAREDLQQLRDTVSTFSEEVFLDGNPEFFCTREDYEKTQEDDKEISDMIEKKHIRIIKFPKYKNVSFEIKIDDRQKGSGNQPMLYLCIPVLSLDGGEDLIGRPANKNEVREFTIDETNYGLLFEFFTEMAKLSKKHKQDVLGILDTILKQPQNKLLLSTQQ